MPKKNFERAPLADPKERRWVDGGLFKGERGKSVCIGIDQSLANFAIAAYSPDDGTYFLWLVQPKSKGVVRLFDLARNLQWVLESIQLRGGVAVEVCMEGPSYGTTRNAHWGGEVAALTKLGLAAWYGIKTPMAHPTLVAPTQLKKWATGVGKGDKNKVLLGAYKKYGIEFDDDNLCDAYCLSRVAASLYTGVTSFAYEREVIDKLERYTEWDKTALPKLSLKESPQKKQSSGSKQMPTRTLLRRPLATPSTTRKRSGSGPSGRVRLIKRSKRVQ